MTVVERMGEWLLGRTSRRSFLARTTMAATAASVAPVDLLIRPGTAYAQLCQCSNSTCDCSQACCDGYTQFCCTIDGGVNACPPGSFAGGWWKADGSMYCAGPRYYIDCQGECHGCSCSGGYPFCPSCDGLTCECALGDCNNRHVGCAEFRYGQCHTEIACSGRILCRMVSCTPPWEIDPTCSTVAQVDDSTANHYAPCQDGPTTFAPPPPTFVGMAPTKYGKGYWIVNQAGVVKAFGDAGHFGDMSGKTLNKPIVGMAATASGLGYWLVASDGGVFSFGDAHFDGSAGGLRLNEPVVGMAADYATGGYWLVASDGGIFSYDAPFDGSEGGARLNQPVVGMAARPDGGGYWLVASDGGVFTFNTPFDGSEGGVRLNKPVVGMAATPTGRGYWLVASDGGIFTFGDAGFHGSAGSLKLNKPITGMAATPTGGGYWLVAADGGIFTYGDAAFYGSGA